MNTVSKKVEVYSHEKFAVELQRLGLNFEQACEKIGVSRPSITHWIVDKKDPQNNKKAMIEKAIKGMNVSDWRKTHVMILTTPELLNVWRLREDKSLGYISNKLKIEKMYIINLFSGMKYIEDSLKEKIVKLTENLWG